MSKQMYAQGHLSGRGVARAPGARIARSMRHRMASSALSHQNTGPCIYSKGILTLGCITRPLGLRCHYPSPAGRPGLGVAARPRPAWMPPPAITLLRPEDTSRGNQGPAQTTGLSGDEALLPRGNDESPSGCCLVAGRVARRLPEPAPPPHRDRGALRRRRTPRAAHAEPRGAEGWTRWWT